MKRVWNGKVQCFHGGKGVGLLAAAAGVAGFFMETHPDPENALSDGPNAWPLDKMRDLLETLQSIDRSVKQHGYQEADYGLGVPDSQ